MHAGMSGVHSSPLKLQSQTVKWTDITDLLLRTCNSLRKQDDWVHCLVDLLSSSIDSEDQQRKVIVNMGDTLVVDETSGEHLHPLPLQRDVLMEPLTTLVLDEMAGEVSAEPDEEPEEQNLQICSFHVEFETDQPECGLMSTEMLKTPTLEHQTNLQPVCVPSVQQQHLHFIL
ncbi:hypothetical protein MHYP_G00250020 [Metynnis hypsauchen]